MSHKYINTSNLQNSQPYTQMNLGFQDLLMTMSNSNNNTEVSSIGEVSKSDSKYNIHYYLNSLFKILNSTINLN
ncbi:hypothetical protein C1646_766877 [Rhizophagus diaphanus]|nr:hypothetical protein C1646_766877 [Rhizophagus diaphanus] [Rhizophagus sp. MUCL 43196]